MKRMGVPRASSFSARTLPRDPATPLGASTEGTRMAGRRRIVIVLLVLVALAAGLWFFSRPSAPSVRLVLHGNVDLRQVSLAFTQNGRVAAMRAQEGETVRKGQILAVLDTEALRLRIAEARAEDVVREQAALALRNGARPPGI